MFPSKQAPRTTESPLQTMSAMTDARSESLSIILAPEFGCLLALIENYWCRASRSHRCVGQRFLPKFIDEAPHCSQQYAAAIANSDHCPCGSISHRCRSTANVSCVHPRTMTTSSRRTRRNGVLKNAANDKSALNFRARLTPTLETQPRHSRVRGFSYDDREEILLRPYRPSSLCFSSNSALSISPLAKRSSRMSRAARPPPPQQGHPPWPWWEP